MYDVKDMLTVSLSVAAFLISLTSFWYGNIRPFRAEVVVGDPTLYFVPLKVLSGATRWIPSVDVQISFYNVGKISGKVYDVRIKFDEADKKINSFTLYAEHVVEFSKFLPLRLDRANWKTAIVSDWSPFLVTPTSDTTLHIVLGGVGLDQVVEGRHTVSLEIFTSQNKKWVVMKTFDIQLWGNMYGRPTFKFLDSKLEKIRKMK